MDEKRKEEETRELTPEEIDDKNPPHIMACVMCGGVCIRG